MTSKYVTDSRACHVTFLRVFPIGLWGVRYSLFIILLLCMYTNNSVDTYLLCMIKARVRWCTCSLWRMF